jgi:hypothetical protein
MEYADRHTDFSRFDESLRTLLRGIVFNRQRWADEDDAALVTDAIKYHQRPVKRPDRRPYTGEDEYIREVLEEILGFDETIPFQERCWERLNEMRMARTEEASSEAAILSAPTGFGKTEGFAGPLFHDLATNQGQGFGKVIIVYPRNALLEDQLERFLVTMEEMRSQYGSDISIGIYNGDVPQDNGGIKYSSLVDWGEFRIAQWTGGDEPVPLEFTYHDDDETYTLEAQSPEGPTFDESQIKLSRKSVRGGNGGNPPDILLTTINSLENFAVKPNYDIIDAYRTFVFDEVHLYRGTYGAHAANVIRNTKRSIEERVDDETGLLFVGSSATIDKPKSFGSDIFDIDPGDISVIETDSGDMRESDDTEHFHFVTSNEDVATSSTFIQQILLFAHGLLEERNGRPRKKALAFIDSVSQVNQRHFQIRDFENASRWQYHDEDEDDWAAVATETPYLNSDPVGTTPGHELIDNDLNTQPTSADLRLRADEFGNTDLILSTSLLEVGIDIPAIKVISQYRAPWEMSQFVQRIGRASRKEGNDAHFLIVLGDDAGDRSLFHRADTFLDPEITTPLNVDNEILEWIHDQLYEAFETVYRIRSAANQPSLNRQRELFIEHFLENSSEESFEDFADFIFDPSSELSTLLRQRVVAPNSLQDLESVEQTYYVLDQIQQDALLSNVASLVKEPAPRVTLQTGSLNGLSQRVNSAIQRTISEIETVMDTATSRNQSAEDTVEDVRNKLDRASDILEDEQYDRRDRYDQLDDLFNEINDELVGVSDNLDGVTESFPFDLGLEEVIAAAQEARTIRTDDDIEEKRQRWQRIYFIKRSLQEYYCFENQRFEDGRVYGHLMVPAIKALLRAVYFYHRAGNLGSARAELEPPHFVPTSYFGEAGETFSVVPEDEGSEIGEDDSVDALYENRFESDEDDEDEVEQGDVPLTKLFFEYAPYMSKYLSDGSLQMFNPPVEEAPTDATEDYYFDVSGLSTDPGEEVITPSTLPVKSVTDQSGDQARAIVWYCEESLYVGRDTWDAGPEGSDTMGYGQLHSNPQVGTSFEPEREITDEFGVGYVSANVRLDSVDLTITPAYPMGDPTGDGTTPFRTDRDNQREVDIGFEQPLGFTLNTRGAIWNLDEFVDVLVGDDVLEGKFARHNPDADIEEAAHYTAAHFLLEVISDISGVNQAQLLYGVDIENHRVAVFEHAEGGQGIVDLFDQVRTRTDHERMLRAINRVAANPQLINGSLWADEDFVRAVRADDQDQIDQYIRNRVVVATDRIVDEIKEQVHHTVDQLDEFADVTGVSQDVAYEIRHMAAQAQFEDGNHDPIDTLVINTPDSVQAEELRNLIVDPDVDDCVENLHLAYSIVEEQSEVLSNVVLERLHDYVTEQTTNDDWAEEVLGREALPGVIINGSNVFHSL